MKREKVAANQLLPEQNRILTKRIGSFVLLLSVLLISLLIFFIRMLQPAQIIDCKCTIIEYYSTLNETDCKIEIECDRDVIDGVAQISFFESSSTIPTSTYNVQLYGDNDNYLWSYLTVSGEVTQYTIESYDFTTKKSNYIPFFLYACVPCILYFISVLLLTCSIYHYNDKTIVVYAGWYHHYILINGEKYDEHNTLIPFTPITLTATLDDGSEVKATISLTNRVALKINGKLYQKESE